MLNWIKKKFSNSNESNSLNKEGKTEKIDLSKDIPEGVRELTPDEEKQIWGGPTQSYGSSTLYYDVESGTYNILQPGGKLSSCLPQDKIM